jgi:hypothetical protein
MPATTVNAQDTALGFDRRTLRGEVLVVLALSLLASAVSAIITLFEQPIAGVTVRVGNQSPMFARQVAGFVFGLAPVYLVVHLVRRTREGTASIGLALDRPREDLLRGAALFALVGAAGVGVYLASVELGVNRFVVPVPPQGRWWSHIALVMNATEAALVEEVLAAYLITRLRQLAWTPLSAIGGVALLRGAYHLYQGWGSFAGNVAMGALFGLVFVRTRRAWPLVVAHLLLDVGAGVGYLLFRGDLPGLV